MTPKQKKLNAKTVAQRKKIFPQIADGQLWSRHTQNGFTTIPRALPTIHVIMDALSNGKPLSATYLALWCRAWDDPFVILGPKMAEVAADAGFTGQKAVNTFTTRLGILERLGFVKFAAGSKGKFHYAVILNPYLALAQQKKKIGTANWNTLAERMVEIGATDLDAPDEPANNLNA